MITVNLTEAELKALIETELVSNIMVLIDPKKKDSFSQARINVWQNTVTERILYHITQK
jgi:tetrahydromethanopterin S-methyltransferase subunit H